MIVVAVNTPSISSAKGDICVNRELNIALPFDKCLQPRLLLFSLREVDIEFPMGVSADPLATEFSVRLSLICIIESRQS